MDTRILIVEDNYENRQLMGEILRDLAICEFAATGKEAIDAYNRSLKEKPYRLIFLDLELPEVNGLDLLTRIRESELEAGIPLGEGIPIIIVTSYQKRYLEAFKRGCDDYLLKPIDAEELIAKFEKFTK